MVEQPERQIVEPVLVAPGIEHKGQQHRVVDRDRIEGRGVGQMGLHRMGEHQQIVLGVVGDLEDRRIFEQPFELFERHSERDLLEAFPLRWRAAGPVEIKLRGHGRAHMADRDIAGFARGEGQGESDQFSPHGVQGRGLRIESHDALVPGPRDPIGQGLFVLHQFITDL